MLPSAVDVRFPYHLARNLSFVLFSFRWALKCCWSWRSWSVLEPGKAGAASNFRPGLCDAQERRPRSPNAESDERTTPAIVRNCRRRRLGSIEIVSLLEDVCHITVHAH